MKRTNFVIVTLAFLSAFALIVPYSIAGEISGRGKWGMMGSPVSLTIDFDAGTFRGEFSDESSLGITSTSELKGTMSGIYKGSKTSGTLEGVADYTETRVSKGIDNRGKFVVDKTTESNRFTFRGTLENGVITGRCYDGETPRFGPFNIPIGGAPLAEGPAVGEDVTPEKVAKLNTCFQDSVREKIKKGYYVKNDGWFRTLKHMVQDRTQWSETGIAGRCGEYGEWGMTWMKDCVEKLFGKKAVIDDIVVMEETTYRPSGPGELAWWNPDRIYESNHRATRVILPNGERCVLDYWDGVSTGEPRMIPEDEWVGKWRTKISRLDSRVDRSSAEQNLKDLIHQMGEEKGMQAFRLISKKNGMSDERIELWIKSWAWKPWRVN